MKLKEVFKGTLYSGFIFNRINELYGLPFINMISDVKVLDFDFMTKFGARETSMLLDDLISGEYILVKKGDDYVIDSNSDRTYITKQFTRSEILDIVSVAVYQRYHLQWDKLYQTMIVEYNPIHNYDMSETEKTGTKISTTDNYNTNSTTDGSDTTNGTTSANGATTNNETNNTTGTTSNSNYGFNSSLATPVSESSNTSNSITANNGTSSNSGNNSSTTNSTNNFNENNTGTRTTTGSADDNVRTLTRQGNIGVTTSQKMLNDERKTWEYDFLEIVFKQVADMLTSQVYVL